jgi:hypothetical protein
MQAATPVIDQLFLTALPNGRTMDNTALRLSLLLTPSLVTSPLSAPFDNWPAHAQNLKWTVTFFNPDHSLISAATSAPIDLIIDPLSINDNTTPAKRSQLWREIFSTGLLVNQRTAHNHLHRSWRVSHDITNLHRRHELHRLSHAYSQISASNNLDMTKDASQLQDDMAPPALFLHPEFNSDDLTIKYDDRARALTNLETVIAALPTTPKDFPKVINKRANYAIATLEEYGGAKLSAASLCAVYISVIKSAGAAGSTNLQLDAAVTTIEGWFGANIIIRATYPPPPVITDYIHMLLFHRRKKMTRVVPTPAVKAPDFHQLLGLVQNHPAIMRPLGLAWDFVVTPPSGLQGTFCVSIALKTQPADVSIKVNSCYTQCTVLPDMFIATPRVSSPIVSGLLNLQAVGTKSAKRFTLVPENADSQALKLTDQSNNASRGTEYSTSAPTAINVLSMQANGAGAILSTPQAVANPSTASPAPRTVGLALFDQDRLQALEQSAAQTPETTGSTTPVPSSDFFADDLILGYRVDVLYKQQFISLCQRASVYDIYSPLTDTKVDTWKPFAATELSADEGFISFAATQSPLQDGGTTDAADDSQTQVHQSIFTWTGWSLSVPAPKFPSINPIPKTKKTDSNFLAIRPTYSLPDDYKLPPLRFNLDYEIRCRIVDLAGNGALPGIDPNNAKYFMYTAVPVTPFSRHEPIRAPQFLLHAPIDRVNQPGTHIDRMVARDNDGESVRILVPPRESLRLAELSGYLKSEDLPSSAFSGQQLLEDGSFPSVACAKQNHWLDGQASLPADNDPIFIYNRNEITIKNPYYPDPLANFIRIEIFELTDDPSKSILVDLVWIKIKEKNQWSQRLPARVRLIPSDAIGSPTVSLDPNASAGKDYGMDSIPTLDVKLPKGSTAVLRISSAAVEGGAAGLSSPEYHVHLSHLTRMHIKNPTAFSSLVIGASAHAVRSLHRLATAAGTTYKRAFESSHIFVNGSLDVTTPKRTMTLVHAVKKPLEEPEFAPLGSGGYLEVIRDAGKLEAHISGQLRAHWLSTSKITCYAEWTDQVDDVTLPCARSVHHREVAFTVTAKELVEDTPFPPNRLRSLDPNLLQHFLDTRAHKITYKLVASTNFREYYPGADTPIANDENYQTNGTRPVNLTVLSSARPLAPEVLYLIPAFVWANTYDNVKKKWYTGRTVVVRVYLDRPFLLSGDRETIGVALFDPNSGLDPAKQNFVSRWGADPTRPITTPILRNELSESNLCEPGPGIETCNLAEGDSARIKPCLVQYSPDRKLWFSDIPINTQHANAPFIRLALVRWQPDSLNGDSEARCSQVVFAEFMQLSADRWVSIQRKSGSKYTITISGAFASKAPQNPFSLMLQKRWYALGGDTGWRNVTCKYDFAYNPATDDSGVSSWSAELDILHSAYLAKYRVLLSEEEFPGQKSRKSFSTFLELP